MLASWSAKENLASFSLGVIRSNPLKSVIFPHLVATWLSATLKTFPLIEEVNNGIVDLLNIPCLKSLKLQYLLLCLKLMI